MKQSTGQFEKVVDSFSEGICELIDISFSIRQSISAGLDTAWRENDFEYPTEKLPDPDYPDYPVVTPKWDEITQQMVIEALKVNDIPEQCGIIRFDNKIEYITSGGLIFGWEQINDKYNFWIIHPHTSGIPNQSSLRISALKYNWIEIMEDE